MRLFIIPIHSKTETHFNSILQITALLVIVITTSVMIIWFVNPEIFLRILPQSATMKFNTALLLGFVAIHIWMTNRRQNTSHYQLDVLALGTLIIASLSLIAYWIKTPIFLDELIVPDPLTPIAEYPGRMSQATALMFILFALAQLLYRHQAKIAEALIVSINLMGLTAIFAFMFDATALYELFFFSSVSFHTALLFVLLSTTAIITLPNGYIHDLIILDEPGGSALRWLLPIILLIPFTVGWLVLQGMNLGLYQPAIALDILVVSIVGIQLIMAVIYAYSTQAWYRKDRENQKQLLDSKIELIELENIRKLKELKEDFFAKISHDMKQPITTIVSSSDIILQYDTKLETKGRMRHVKRIRNQAMTMLDFVDDIMLLSQVEFDTVPFNPIHGDMVDLCRSYAQNFFEMNELETHQLVLDICAETLFINYDVKLLRRLLGNLLSNAIKYSPDGGHITFHVSETDQHAIIAISDEGIGIPPEDITTLFNLFERASNIEEIKGHGIGLAIVRQIVTLHQATVDVQSTVGVGTTFTIKFPRI